MRYISTDEVKNHLEFDEINESDDPKLSVVERWINGSEAEVDSLTHQRWDLHTIENELIRRGEIRAGSGIIYKAE